MAQDIYCWRCDKTLPMLDEEEWLVLEPALVKSIEDIQSLRSTNGIGLAEATKHPFGQAAKDLYQQLTGHLESDVNVLWHHRLSIYGPPCSDCGKPLRTPQAKLCAACGEPRA